MEKAGDDAASKFINALIKSVQTLCHGYLDFHNGIEIIGHINLSVDQGNSMDYILKEKVCKNAENSTLFISNSFHAEPKPEQEVPGKNSQTGSQVVHSKQSTDSASGESGKVSSAISSISSALSGSRERHRRSSVKDSDSHSQQSTAKRKASEDHSESRPAKVPSHHDQTSSGSPYPPTSSSPEDSKMSLRALASMGTSDADMSETMLPQTANVTSDNAADIGVNLAGSVLEPVDDQSNPDLPERDDDSDGDLEVTFIKEEYVEGERSACEYDNSGQQFGDSHHRGSEGMSDPSLFPVALHSSSSASATYVPSAHELGAIAQHFPPGSVGPSTSQPQPGPSGMRDQDQDPGDGVDPFSMPRWPHPDLGRILSAAGRQPTPSSRISGGPSRLELMHHLIHSQRFAAALPPIAQDHQVGMGGGPSTSTSAIQTNATSFRKLPTRRFQRGALIGQSTRDETGNISYRCRMCEAKFKTSSGLAYHERQNHTDLPQYRCNVCAKGFVSRGHYVGHMNMHNNTKTFACTVCYKSFAYMSSLKFHLKMHTNTQVFECPICAKKFAYEKSFKSHLNTHNRANAFDCPHCPKKFAYRSSLQHHLKSGCMGGML